MPAAPAAAAEGGGHGAARVQPTPILDADVVAVTAAEPAPMGVLEAMRICVDAGLVPGAAPPPGFNFRALAVWSAACMQDPKLQAFREPLQALAATLEVRGTITVENALKLSSGEVNLIAGLPKAKQAAFIALLERIMGGKFAPVRSPSQSALGAHSALALGARHTVALAHAHPSQRERLAPCMRQNVAAAKQRKATGGNHAEKGHRVTVQGDPLPGYQASMIAAPFRAACPVLLEGIPLYDEADESLRMDYTAWLVRPLCPPFSRLRLASLPLG